MSSRSTPCYHCTHTLMLTEREAESQGAFDDLHHHPFGGLLGIRFTVCREILHRPLGIGQGVTAADLYLHVGAELQTLEKLHNLAVTVGQNRDPVYSHEHVAHHQLAVSLRHAASHNALDLQEFARPVASDDRKAEPLRRFLQHNLHHLPLKVSLEFLVARGGWVRVRVRIPVVPESSVWPHGGRFCLSLLLQGCCGLEAGGRFS